MKFISWNVNGLRACISKGFNEFFEKENADIFCIQETKLQEGQAELAKDGYCIYINSAEKKGYSGTLVYAKKEPIAVTYGIDGKYNDEGRIITLEYENFFFVCAYVPNAQRELARIDYRMVYEDEIRNYLIGLNSKKPVVYAGDLNVARSPLDLKNAKSNEGNAGYSVQERTKIEELLNSGFVDSFRYLYPEKIEYSWWSYMFNARKNNSGWRIDYFIVSESAKSKIIDSKIYTDVMGSDHAPVGLEIDF